MIVRTLRSVVAGAALILAVDALTVGSSAAAGRPGAAPPDLPPAPPAATPVLDDAHVLSAGLVQQLDQQLGRDNTSGTAQLAVATVPGTDGLPIATYADELFNAWGIGSRSANDGVLVLVAPDQRQVRIQTGRGLGGRLSDSAGQAIIDADMLPAFRAGQDDQAVGAGVEAVRQELGLPVDAALPKVDATAAGAGPTRASNSGSSGTSLITVLIWILVAVGVLGLVGFLVRRGTGRGGGPGDRCDGFFYSGGGGMGDTGGGGFGGGSSDGGGATGGW